MNKKSAGILRKRTKRKKKTIETDPVTQTWELSDMVFEISVITMSNKTGDNVETITRELGSTKKNHLAILELKNTIYKNKESIDGLIADWTQRR